MSEWIPCSEKLPNEHQNVLVCGVSEMYVGYVDEYSRWYVSAKGEIALKKPIAWMPLPSEPVFDEDGNMENKDVLEMIEFAINATDTNDEYSVGLRNGLKLDKSYLTGEEPKFDTVK